jgi:transposase InsO family protein
MNAVAERFVRSVKAECLDRLILFGDAMLRRALLEYVAHYHQERNHQGLDNRIVRPAPGTIPTKGPVVRRERLGGLLSYYHRRRRAG